MSSGVFNQIDSNKDGYISQLEWSSKLRPYSDMTIIDGQDFSDLAKSLGLQLCPSQYYALPVSQNFSCACDTQSDLYIYRKDQKQCSLEAKPLFEKYAAQDWWGFKDADKMSEDEFQTMVKELNDPCRA